MHVFTIKLLLRLLTATTTNGFSKRSSESSRVTYLLLSFWNLFNEDPGHCRPACADDRRAVYLSLLYQSSCRKASWSRLTCLLLSFSNFFNEDPGHRPPAWACVGTVMAVGTLSNPESHSHLSLVYVITVTFNMALTKKIVVPAGLHVERTFNGARRAALSAIEDEIPTTRAAVTCDQASLFFFAAGRYAWYNYLTFCLLLVQNLDFSLTGQETKGT